MMIHKYKLKMTVDGVEHYADINFNDVLNNVFNKRKKRIRDYGENVYPSNQNTLSGYMTGGIGVTNDNDVPMIPMHTNFIWKGYRDTNYTNLSGNIGKVALMCERIVRESGYDFYTAPVGTLFPSTLVGMGWGADLGEYKYYPMALDQNGETLICTNGDEIVGYNRKDVRFARINVLDTRWGLKGIEGENAYARSQKAINNFRISRSVSLSTDFINHNYTYNSDAKASLFEVDMQTESATFGDETINYKTWNCLLNCRNDYYGTSEGTTVTQDDNYIYVFEYLLGALIRLGQYNDPEKPYSQYPFMPQNCEYYYNMSTREIEGLGTIEFKPLLTYAVIDKQTMEIIQQNQIFLTNTTNIDCSAMIYHGAVSLTTDTQIELDENTAANMDVINNKYPFRLFATCADNDYVYFESGYTDTSVALFKLDTTQIRGENPPQTLTIEEVSTGNIANFCHTINRTNLYYVASKSSGRIAALNKLVNKQTGIVNWIGFIDWMVSGVADFGGVTVNAGQTVRFELIEDIENEE